MAPSLGDIRDSCRPTRESAEFLVGRLVPIVGDVFRDVRRHDPYPGSGLQHTEYFLERVDPLGIRKVLKAVLREDAVPVSVWATDSFGQIKHPFRQEFTLPDYVMEVIEICIYPSRKFNVAATKMQQSWTISADRR